MKKAIVLLLALAVLGGAVFAQATVTGYVRTIATYTQDGFSLTGERIRLNLGWTSEDSNVMFKARLQGGFGAALPPAFAYGTIKLLDGMVAVTGGYTDNWDYDLSSGLSDYSLGNVANGGAWNGKKGMIFQVMPVEGLSVGLLATPDGTDLYHNQFMTAASYTIAGIGDVVLTSDFVDPIVSASFKYTGFEGLGVTLGYKGLDTVGIYGIVDYAMDALTAQLAGDYNVDNKTMYFETSVKYVAGAWTVMGLFGYDKDGDVLGTAKTADTFKLNTPTAPGAAQWVADKAAAAAVPSKFFIGAEIAYNMGKGQIAINPTFDDAKEFSLPIVVKVSF